jgi:hypothetical protein
MQLLRSWFAPLFGLAVALGVALAPMPTGAQSTERTRRLDGSSAASFETSVALLQNELSQSRREDFATALAVIWTRNTASSGDFDSDGDLDLDDIRLLEADADDLLTQILRGNVVSAIEEREQDGAAYTAADYFEQLDGLGYDEVVSLAGRPSSAAYQAAQTRARLQASCYDQVHTSRAESRSCERFFDEMAQTLDVRTGRRLNTAAEALNARRHAEARAAIGTLNFATLNAYERSKTEQILFSISYGEGKPAEAREHLLEALAAGGLNAQEISGVLDLLRALDAELAGGAP